jgi:Tfp pilus assembly protein PilN
MTNLLPYNQKKLVHRLAFLKLLTVTFAALLLLLVLGAILFFPTLITINSRYRLAQNQVLLLEKSGAIASPVDIASFDALTNALVQKLAAPSVAAPTEYIDTILSVVPAGIVIDGYTLSSTDAKAISVHGIAATREALQSYISMLEALPRVDMVDSPISNYVASKNSEFSITVSFE